MEQIYIQVLELVREKNVLRVNGRSLPIDGYSQIALKSRFHEIGNEGAKAFICALVALNKVGPYNHVNERLSFRKNATATCSQSTFNRRKKYLVDRHIISEVSGKRRLILNPEFNPSFTERNLEHLSGELNMLSRKLSVPAVPVISLKQKS